MSVRKKTLVVMAATTVGLIAILYFASRSVLLGTLASFEQRNARRSVEQVVGALSRELTGLDRMTADWALWDDTYKFIEDGNETFIRTNCVDPGFTNLRLNLMLFIHSSGRIVYGTGFDWRQEKKEPVPRAFLAILKPDCPLFHPPSLDVGVTGIVLLPEAPMMVAARQILTSEGEGPSRGTLIWGRYLDAGEVSRLSEMTRLSMVVQRFDDEQMSPDLRAARLSLAEGVPTLVRLRRLDRVSGYTAVRDIYGKRALLVRVDFPTAIYEAVRYFFVWLAAAGLVFSAVTLLLLERIVLSRLAHLTADVTGVGESGDPTARVSLPGKDELSGLASRINAMLQGLERSQEELRKINRALRVVNECNQALVRATEERELLDEICRIIVEEGAYRLAWVGYAEADEAKTVRPVARAGYEEGYLDTVHITWTDTESGRGPEGTAIRTREPCLVFDVRTDPRFALWRVEAVQRGYASAIGLPLIGDGQTLGALTIYAAEPHAFDEEEVALLTGLANDLAYGITAIRSREQHRRAEAAVGESEERYRELAELLPETVFETDENGRFLFVNRLGLEVFGYSAEDVKAGLNMLQCLVPEDRERAAENFRGRLSGQGTGGTEYTGLRKDGSTAPILVYSSPILREGQPVGLRGIAVDIGERKRAESERLRMERLSALGELASGVAHDFNNVLFGVLGFAELLRNELVDPRLQRYCDRILQAATDGGQIVRRMQSFYRSHLETREKKYVDVNQLAREALELTRPRWKDRPEAEGIPVEVLTDLGEVQPVEGVASELREVFTNLIFNALDAMPSGGRLSLSTCMASDRQVGIWVTDTGAGMDEETQQRCFDAFYTTKGEGGSGLGLSLVHRIISEHDGIIELDSEPGRGTTFAIFLPIATRATEEVRPTAAPVPQASLRLLVIDDEEAVREILRDSLKQWGHSVEVAENGAQGIQLFREGVFDVVVTDLGMPEMNGLDVAEAVHSHNPNTPIILLTGWSGNFDPRDVERSGFAAILRKPLRPQELATALHSLMTPDPGSQKPLSQ